MFPSERHAKVLWAGVEAKADLIVLHRAIGRALTDAIGFRPEERPYSPHITLARLDEPAPPDVIDRYLRRTRDSWCRLCGLTVSGCIRAISLRMLQRYLEEAAFPLIESESSR